MQKGNRAFSSPSLGQVAVYAAEGAEDAAAEAGLHAVLQAAACGDLPVRLADDRRRPLDWPPASASGLVALASARVGRLSCVLLRSTDKAAPYPINALRNAVSLKTNKIRRPDTHSLATSESRARRERERERERKSAFTRNSQRVCSVSCSRRDDAPRRRPSVCRGARERERATKALALVRTSHLLLVDVDFFPSAELYAAILDQRAFLVLEPKRCV